MYILGIDPGSRLLGWGGLELDANGKLVGCDQGVLAAVAKGSFLERLDEMAGQVQELVAQKKPDFAVIERLFLGRNADSAFKLGHVRGVCVVECQRRRAQIVEYTPREVKKVITGSGGADKMAVRQMLYAQLGIPENVSLSHDASDALALAYCFYVRRQVHARFSKSTKGDINF